MDIVLGVSMAPASVQMVLLQGENADGATVDENDFAVPVADDSPTVSASDRVLAAILGTREDAASAGLELSAVGVACTDQLEAAALRDALAAHKMENVMLVSAFLAATALTQSIGGAMGYERTAVLFVEPGTATLAVVETSDGSIADVREEQLNTTSGQIFNAELMEMVARLDELPTRPGGLFVIGSGVDIAAIKPHLEEATSLTVNAAEEPETALARGAALASANAPLFASSTAALAYAQDPGTGAVDMTVLPEYLSLTGAEVGVDDLAYSAAADDEASAPTLVISSGPGAAAENEPRRRPGLLVGTAFAVAGISAALALEVALSLGIRTTVGLLPAPIQGFVAPVEQALVPAPWPVTAKAVAPKPQSVPAAVPPSAASVPAAPVPALPLPAAPAPAAPAVPVPVVVPPIAPVPSPPVYLPPPPVYLPEPPASPPVIPAPPHASPPPHSPPPHQAPPGQGPLPNPGDRPGGPSGRPGDGGPVNGPGPAQGNPGDGGPHGGGPIEGPAPSHGTPGSGPPESGAPPGGGAPRGGAEPPSGGGPVGGGETHGGGGPVGGSETSGGGGPVGGGGAIGGESGGGSHGGEVGGGGGFTGGSSGGGSSSTGGGGSSTGGAAGSGGGESGGHR